NTPPHPPVDPNNNDQLTIEVIDTGEGIKPEQAGKLFTPFVQGDAGMDRRFGGTGLGLAISRKLARSMGGDITLTSQLGQGSTFRLTLPVRPGTPKNATLTSLTCPLPTPPARPDKATAT
ncbi:MAG: ATP-binding protein, partial [bacterium]